MPASTSVNGRPVATAKKAAVFRQGDAADAIFRVEEGCVRLEVATWEGRRDIVAFLFPGDVFGAGTKQRWGSAYAVDDAILTRFPARSLSAVLAGPPAEVVAIMESGDALLALIARRVGLVGHSSASTRLRGFLFWLLERTGKPGSGVVHLPMSRRDIADFLGMAPETVSRAFERLERRGDLRRLAQHACLLSGAPEERVEARRGSRRPPIIGAQDVRIREQHSTKTYGT